MSKPIFEAVDNLATGGITVMALNSLDFVIPGQWQNLVGFENTIKVVTGTDDQEYWRAEGWPWGAATSDWQPGTIWPDGHEIALPATMPPGCYRVDISFYNPDTFDPLGETFTVGQLRVEDQTADDGNNCS